MSMSAPCSVIAPVVGLVEMTVAPGPIESTPAPAPTVPSALVSADKESVPEPVSSVAPASTLRLPAAVTSSVPLLNKLFTLPRFRSPNPARYVAVGCVTEPTAIAAGGVVASNCNGLPGLPIAPEVSSISSPSEAISPAAIVEMPPLPAFKVRLVPLVVRRLLTRIEPLASAISATPFRTLTGSWNVISPLAWRSMLAVAEAKALGSIVTSELSENVSAAAGSELAPPLAMTMLPASNRRFSRVSRRNCRKRRSWLKRHPFPTYLPSARLLRRRHEVRLEWLAMKTPCSFDGA